MNDRCILVNFFRLLCFILFVCSEGVSSFAPGGVAVGHSNLMTVKHASLYVLVFEFLGLLYLTVHGMEEGSKNKKGFACSGNGTCS